MKRKSDRNFLDELVKTSPAIALSMALANAAQQPPPKKAKRRPLLLDELLAAKRDRMAKECIAVLNRLPEAKVFVFDEQAAIYAARMMAAHPEAIAHDVEFAIPPYQRMYIEFPYERFFDITSPPETRGPSDLGPDEEDIDVGYFIDGPMVYITSRVRNQSKDMHPMLLPIRYRLNRTFTFHEEKATAEVMEESRIAIDAVMWGSCHNTLLERKDKASLRALRDNHSFEFWYGKDKLTPGDMRYILHTSAGDLRNIVGMLLFLNRTRDVQVVDELPPAPGWVRAKPRTLVRHNIIRLKLDPGPLLQRIFKGRASGGWRREHDVRGHFCHNRNYHEHKHDHDMREIGINQWKCLLCGGLKWWKKEHHRGRKDAGQVRTAYEVSK